VNSFVTNYIRMPALRRRSGPRWELSQDSKRPSTFVSSPKKWSSFFGSRCGGKFVALDARWPIGRIAEPSTHQASRFHPFEAPLRVMAFISAAGISGKLEFDALYAAIEKGRQKGLQILLEVLVGEEQLHDSIKAAIQANRIKNTSVYPIPDQGGVKDHILEFDPQILHFFCHGHTGHGVAQLELATFADWVAHSPSGSTVVRINDLEAMAASSDTDIWLITLNCCLGARPVDGLPSMARSLVTAGAPAVVGMAEPMAALDANEFTRQFYPEVLTTFASRLVNSPPGNSVNFEWAEMLYRARSALGSANARNTAKDREWAIPVLYTRPESFSVALVSDALRQKVETLAEWLRTLGPNTPDRIRDMIHQEMMPPNVPPSLRPDRFGNFPE